MRKDKYNVTHGRAEVAESIGAVLIILGIVFFWILVYQTGAWFESGTLKTIGIGGVIATCIWIIIPVVGFVPEKENKHEKKTEAD